MARVLCLDDDGVVRALLEHVVAQAGHEAVGATHVPEALQLLARGDIDLIIADYQLPGIDGLEFLQMLADARSPVPVIMVTAHGGVDHAIQAIRAGAVDYLLKPFLPEELLHRVQVALEGVRLKRELAALRQEVMRGRSARQLIGKSAALMRALEIVAAAATSRATVLIEGESGTGKELVAVAIHDQGPRSERPFIKLNCAALPPGLIESALFGHEKGAFTGAIRRVEGAFERADGGTLLLDEISEMHLDLQAKLLRVLQEREFERVGGAHPIKVDVRVIATTNRNLASEAERGAFRSDLYYRLNVLAIAVPPLRERREDIPVLAFHFATQAAAEAGKPFDSISPEAMALLQKHAWPGNVRELQHAVERAVILSALPVLEIAAFDAIQRAVAGTATPLSAHAIRGAYAGSDSAAGDAAITLPSLNLAEAEAALIARALEQTDNNRTHAATLLGIGVRTLRKKLNPRASEPETPAS